MAVVSPCRNGNEDALSPAYERVFTITTTLRGSTP